MRILCLLRTSCEMSPSAATGGTSECAGAFRGRKNSRLFYAMVLFLCIRLFILSDSKVPRRFDCFGGLSVYYKMYKWKGKQANNFKCAIRVRFVDMDLLKRVPELTEDDVSDTAILNTN